MLSIVFASWQTKSLSIIRLSLAPSLLADLEYINLRILYIAHQGFKISFKVECPYELKAVQEIYRFARWLYRLGIHERGLAKFDASHGARAVRRTAQVVRHQAPLGPGWGLCGFKFSLW